MSNVAQQISTKTAAKARPVTPKKRRPARFDYLKMVRQLPPASTLVVNDVSWEDYEALLEGVGEATGLRISYNEGMLEVMTVSVQHEGLASFVQDLIRLISLRQRLRVLFFGSATIKRTKKEKGSEPDLCFYLQSVSRLKNPARPDFATDPPPDVVVEIDIHHKSLDKFPIYAALGVPEIWHYDGRRCTLHGLANGQYVALTASQALPILTAAVLTTFLNRLKTADQYDTLLAFEEWLTAANTESAQQ